MTSDGSWLVGIFNGSFGTTKAISCLRKYVADGKKVDVNEEIENMKCMITES